MGCTLYWRCGRRSQGLEAAHRRFMTCTIIRASALLIVRTYRARQARLTRWQDIDLMQGETAETTTQMGLKLLDTFRQTADKRYVLSTSYCDRRTPSSLVRMSGSHTNRRHSYCCAAHYTPSSESDFYNTISHYHFTAICTFN